MKKIDKILRITILAMIICLVSSLQVQYVQGATYYVLSYGERSEADNLVTLYIDGVEKLTKNYTTTIYYDYESIDGNDWYDDDKKATFQKAGSNSWKYKLKLKEKGIYKIYVECTPKKSGYTKIKSNKIKVKYDNTKPQFKLDNLPQLKIGGHEYHNYYEFFGNPKKDGNTYYYKGTSAQIGVVVYEGGISVNDIKCKVGGSTYNGGAIDRNKGHVQTRFTINGEVDGQVSFTVANKNGISASVSTGKTIVIDNTKPVVKIDTAYSSKAKTIYKNKSVSVPITITEKHFDSGNTKVLINGNNTNVSWQSSGDKHTASVKLSKGENVISVVSTDKAGNVSSEEKSAKIIIDTEAPSVKISGDVENKKSYGNRYGQYTEYSIKVEISDKYLAGKQSATLYKMNAATNKVIEKKELDGSKSGKNYKFSLPDIKDDGYYKLEVSAVDKAGNKITSKSLNKQGKYEVSKGKVIGYFYINRNGSKYVIEKNSEQYYEPAVNEMGNIVIYEYNINNIKKENLQVTLLTTLGEHKLTLNKDYTWEDISKDKKTAQYQYVYKYTIKPENFSDGLYSVKIVSSADVIGDGNNSLKVEASNDTIMNQIINYDTKEPEVLSVKKTGNEILIHVRDENPNQNSAKLKIGGQEIELKPNEDLSTSTNLYYTGSWNGDITNAEFTFSDLAGNNVKETSIQTNEENNSFVWIILLLIVITLILIVVTVIISVVVRRKK